MTPNQIFANQQILTLDVARSLVGKKIAITSAEYEANQEVSHIIVISSIEKQKDVLHLKEGDTSFGRCNPKYDQFFFGSDADRPIFYVVLDEN